VAVWLFSREFPEAGMSFRGAEANKTTELRSCLVSPSNVFAAAVEEIGWGMINWPFLAWHFLLITLYFVACREIT
jgi:hypothetical protein